MTGARGIALIGGIVLLVAGVWQTMLYSGAPDGGAEAWMGFFAAKSVIGKTWGLRIAVSLLLIAPLYTLATGLENGWGRAGTAFLLVWLPLSAAECVLQTVPIETMRDWADPSAGGLETAHLTAYAMWDAVLEPLRAVNALIGVFALALLAAGCGGKMPYLGAFLMLAALGVSAFLGVSATVESSFTILEGALIGAVALGAPRKEPDPMTI